MSELVSHYIKIPVPVMCNKNKPRIVLPQVALEIFKSPKYTKCNDRNKSCIKANNTQMPTLFYNVPAADVKDMM